MQAYLNILTNILNLTHHGDGGRKGAQQQSYLLSGRIRQIPSPPELSPKQCVVHEL
jgi:hypothetical protein